MTSSRTDRARQVLTVAGAVGQVVLPTLLAPRFDEGEQPPNVLSPAPAAFAVWLPIFVSSLAHASFQAMPGRREDPVLRTVGGPAALAYAATAAWAPLVRGRRYWAAQGALFVIGGAAEVARRRLAAAEANGLHPADVRRAVVPSVAMFAAWGAAASAVNLGAMLVGEGPVPRGGPARVTGTVLTLAASATAVKAATAAPGGVDTSVARTYLATIAWALGGIAVGQRRHSPAVAASAVAGLLPVGGLLARSVLTRRARDV